jgi:outer membrane protein assembly factor BamD (BamD/ComL family)
MKYTTSKTNSCLFIPALLLTALVFVSGCATKVDPYKEDLTTELYFQKAHEASDNGNYALAIDYYKAFQQKFPNEIKGSLWASFEIAFIYHKQGNNDEAITLLQAILDKYQAPDAETYPQAPKILTEKVMAGIRNKAKGSPVTKTEPTAAPEKAK